jgi:hypothetical protein
MIVNIPISYKITGVRKSNTTQSTSNRVEIIPFELEELDSSDTPIVASWMDEDTKGWIDRYVRMNDGLFIEPVSPDRFLQPFMSHKAPFVSNALLMEAIKSGGTILTRAKAERTNRPFEDEYATVVAEGRTDAISKMRGLMANLFSIDGRIYRRTHCPKLCVKSDVRSMPDKTGDNFANCGGTVLKVVTDNYAGLGRHAEFVGMRDLSFAISRVKRLNAKVVRKDAWHELNRQLASNISIDHDAEWPDDMPSLIQGYMTVLMNSINSTTLQRSPLPFLKAYCDVYECWQRLPDPDCLDELEDALRAFAPHMRSAELDNQDVLYASKIIEAINSRDVAFQAISDNSIRSAR